MAPSPASRRSSPPSSGSNRSEAPPPVLLFLIFLIGAGFGAFRASRRGGDRLDQLQYAAAHGILFVLVALTVSVVGAALGLF